MKNAPYTRVIIFVLFSVFCFTISHAQTQFISDVTPPSPLSQKQQNMLNRIQNNPVYKSSQWVTMGNITDSQDSTGLLSFTIPGRTGSIHVLPKRIRAVNPNNYEWYGNLTDNDSTGDVHFLNQSGKITASISLAGEVYEIYATDNNIHLLVKYDTAQLNTHNKCGNDTSNTLKSNIPNHKISTPILGPVTCPNYVKVLILYTPAAKQAVADINQTVALCVSHFNTAIYNSGITSSAVLMLAGSQQYNFTETNLIANDVQHLYTDPSVQSTRNSLKADLVILLTNAASYGSINGQAATIGPNDNLSYAIVQVNAAVSSVEAFTHEAGHLYGCRHEIQSDPNGVQYAHGYSFNCFLTTYHTVMVSGAVIRNTKYKLLNFSNPDVTVHCKPTGTTGLQNNAREISETFTTISTFRPPASQPLYANASGLPMACCFHYVTFTSSYGCGTAPYTFEWRTSADGINYGSVMGTSENFSENVPCISQTYQYIKVTVHSADGQTASGVTQIFVDHSCMGFSSGSIVEGSMQTKSNKILSFSLKAVPNPFTKSTNINFKIEKQSVVKLEIYNSFGQPIITILNSKLSAGVYTKNFNAGNLSKGIYVCKLTVDKAIETKYLIVQ